jgi:predicted TIM-barrel fold metal-dependent hydrolase
MSRDWPVPVAGRTDGRQAGGQPGPAALNPPFGTQGANLSRLSRAPSTYLSQFHYDACTYSGPVLRFLIDAVGIDRVMLGTDYPAPMFLDDPVNWLNGLDELTTSEKQAILSTNASRFLGL